MFSVQAEILDESVRANRRPNGRSYVRLLALARRVEGSLAALGMAPRDLLDVYDFMWTTLRPSARKQQGTLPLVMPTASRPALQAAPKSAHEAAAPAETRWPAAA